MIRMTPIVDVVEIMLSQDGDEYVFGAEASPDDYNPEAFDCSELVQWACARAGVQPVMPDGSWIQARHCLNNLTLIPIDEAIDTYGALLFKFGSDPFKGPRPDGAHVAVSLGDGTTIEARSTRHGVGTFTAYGRGWTHAATIPGCDYTPIQEEDVTFETFVEGIVTGWAEDVPKTRREFERLQAIGVLDGSIPFWIGLLQEPANPQWLGMYARTQLASWGR